jgi:hypothetical protein
MHDWGTWRMRRQANVDTCVVEPPEDGSYRPPPVALVAIFP